MKRTFQPKKRQNSKEHGFFKRMKTRAVELSQGEQIQEYLNNIIEEQIEIKKIDDIYKAFEHDLNNDFKTVMKWSF